MRAIILITVLMMMTIGTLAHGLEVGDIRQQIQDDKASYLRSQNGHTVNDYSNCSTLRYHKSELNQLLFQAGKLTPSERDKLIAKIASDIKAIEKMPANYFDSDQVAARDQINEFRMQDGQATGEAYFQGQDLSDTEKCVTGFKNPDNEAQRQNVYKIVEVLQAIEKQNGKPSGQLSGAKTAGP